MSPHPHTSLCILLWKTGIARRTVQFGPSIEMHAMSERSRESGSYKSGLERQYSTRKISCGGDVASRLSSAGMFRRAVLSNQIPFVCSAQPARHSERLASQQGLFLCPGNLGIFDFESNLLQQIAMGKYPEYFAPVWKPAQVV